MCIFYHTATGKLWFNFPVLHKGRFWEPLGPALPFYFSLLGWVYWKKMGKGEGEREGMRKGQREEFSAMLNLDSQLCLHSWLVFQNFSSNALVFLQFHVAMALCTYTLQWVLVQNVTRAWFSSLCSPS